MSPPPVSLGRVNLFIGTAPKIAVIFRRVLLAGLGHSSSVGSCSSRVSFTLPCTDIFLNYRCHCLTRLLEASHSSSITLRVESGLALLTCKSSFPPASHLLTPTFSSVLYLVFWVLCIVSFPCSASDALLVSLDFCPYLFHMSLCLLLITPVHFHYLRHGFDLSLSKLRCNLCGAFHLSVSQVFLGSILMEFFFYYCLAQCIVIFL